MSILNLPERMLQRAAHSALADPSRSWKCTNNDEIQVVAAGLTNVSAGPDFQDMAVLHNGLLYVGDGEFHRRTSDWHAHAHTGSERYRNLLLHVVADDDVADTSIARWTLIIPADVLGSALAQWRSNRNPTQVEVEELQHFALLRLLRLTADAQALVTRLGVHEAIKAMTGNWITRLQQSSRRPNANTAIQELRLHIADSSLGLLVRDFVMVPSAHIVEVIQQCEKQRIATEGSAMRREVMVNVILPMLCARATHDQRIVLLHWYWGAKATHVYGGMNRRFAGQPQDYVWEQQGMLEYLRHHGRRVSTCGEAIRAYGVSGALEFLRATE